MSWRNRGPKPPADGGPQFWRGQSFRQGHNGGQQRWANRGGRYREYYAQLAREGKIGTAKGQANNKGGKKGKGEPQGKIGTVKGKDKNKPEGKR